MRRNGFTLVELLVVIAVISVLAALLLPTLERAVEMGRRTVCAGNQKQMYVAWSAYASDFNDRLPAHDFQGGLRGMSITASTRAYSPFRHWMVFYAGVTRDWENWSPSGGGIATPCDAITTPRGNYGPYPRSREGAVYCPSAMVNTVNLTYGTTTNTRRFNAYVPYYFNGLGQYMIGLRYLGGTNLYEYMGGPRFSRQAEGIETAAGKYPVQLLGDYTLWNSDGTQANSTGYMMNHAEQGGNFTAMTGETKWADHVTDYVSGWTGSYFRTHQLGMYTIVNMGQPLLELAVNDQQRIGQYWTGTIYRGCLPNQTADDLVRALGYRRSSLMYLETSPFYGY